MTNYASIYPMGMSADAMNWFNMAYQYQQPQFKGNSQVNGTQATAQAESNSQSEVSAVPMVSESSAEETKKGGKGWLTATGLIAVGGACLLARKKGGGSIKKGVKILWDSVRGNKQSMQLAEDGDKWVAKIGKPNVINERQGRDIAAQAKKLGLHAYAPENGFKDAEAKLARYTAKIDGCTVKVVNGKNGTKIVSCQKGDTEIKDALTKEEHATTKTAIDEFMKKVESKDAEALGKLENVTYSYKDKDGTVRWFKDASESNQNGTITSVITDKFNASEPNNTLSKYLLDNPKADERMKAIIKDGKFGDDVKVAAYEYNLDGVGMLKIENGEIIGITKDGTFIPSYAADFAPIQ